MIYILNKHFIYKKKVFSFYLIVIFAQTTFFFPRNFNTFLFYFFVIILHIFTYLNSKYFNSKF